MSDDDPIHGWTRREVLGMVGAAAGVALPNLSLAATPTFPQGAVIRTVLKDYAPDDLAGAATLFHEHMSLAADFLTRFDQYASGTNAANGTPPAAAAPNDVSFMQDLDLMSQELIAARKRICRSSRTRAFPAKPRSNNSTSSRMSASGPIEWSSVISGT